MNTSIDPVNKIIAKILVIGIYVTIFFYCFGILLLFLNGKDFSSPHKDVFDSFESFLENLFSLKPEPFFYLGTIALIFTPFARVFYSIVIFYKRREKRFVFISSMVTIILIITIITGLIYTFELG